MSQTPHLEHLTERCDFPCANCGGTYWTEWFRSDSPHQMQRTCRCCGVKQRKANKTPRDRR